MPMNKVWSPEAWNDYLWWQSQDRKTLKRINALILSVVSVMRLTRDDLYASVGDSVDKTIPSVYPA